MDNEKITPPEDLQQAIEQALVATNYCYPSRSAEGAEALTYSEPFQAYLRSKQSVGAEGVTAEGGPREPVTVTCTVDLKNRDAGAMAETLAHVPGDAQVFVEKTEGGLGSIFGVVAVRVFAKWTEER